LFKNYANKGKINKVRNTLKEYRRLPNIYPDFYGIFSLKQARFLTKRK
jgi:hypothetical protein